MKNTDGGKIKFKDIQEIFVKASEPGVLYYRYEYEGKWEGTKLFSSGQIFETPLQLRIEPKGLAKAKILDLTSLLKAGLIPAVYQEFYSTLVEEE